MQSSVRYEILNSEDDSPAEEMAVTAASSVPETAASDDEVTVVETEPQDGLLSKIPEPPSYNIATSLPTYEEAEQNKETDELHRQQREQEQSQTSASPSAQQSADIHLGTDGIFICSFLFAFLFNCVGLFAILCVSQTIAARFGAVSGFGLSIVKYVALMKYQNWVSSWNDGYSWLWWFMLFLGLLMFFRGCLQYIRIKHQWTKLSQQVRGRIYLYF